MTIYRSYSDTIDKKFNELIIPGCLVGAAYMSAQLGKDLAWRAITHLAVVGAEGTELALQSLEGAGFISPLSSQAITKARYVGNAAALVFAVWKGPAFLFASVRKTKELFGNMPNVLKSPFRIKQYWINHPDRTLLTKQQTAALGAASVVVAALLAGPERTSWAVEQIGATPGLVADYILNALNISKDGWFSSAATPTWTKWVTAVPLAATGWWAVNKAASGVLWGVNKVLQGAQTPVHCDTYQDLYRQTSAELREVNNTHWDEKRALEDARDTWKRLINRIIDNLAPNVSDKLQALTSTILEAHKKELEERRKVQ